MHILRSSLLLAVIALVGCDRITGEYEQKIYDAEAIGYACRVSLKPPEDCMKENDTQSPTSILDGWKAADKDIVKGTLDPSMGKSRVRAAPPANETSTIVLPPIPGKTDADKKTDKPAAKTAH